ncbi:serine/arginine repetitive matrix protein 1-like isoform X4 [Pecten maximus]|uniref:serine/arginine repetitive matrix protein 1-like isoform X4 n=1 Tax=Pecten maximus TaxID=6579 RepID=UPI001458EB93|nr:serine/arginine repetitive matrix protein 1-like isoform X4 [Pecten maximus]
MSENNTLHSGWLERITKDVKGKEKREQLWSVLKRNRYVFFFTDQSEHTGETHIGKLPINANTVFTRREKEEKKYGGYVFTIFARDRNMESNVKFKTNKKSAMEQWRGYISIVAKDLIPPDLDLPTDCIQEMGFIRAELRRTTKEPEVQRSVHTNFSRDSGILHDSISSVTVTTERTSASGGSSGGSGTSSAYSEGGRGKTIIFQRHKFSNNPNGDDVYPSWFISNCSREKAVAIFTKVGTKYGNTLMRESAQSASQGTYVISYCSGIKDRIPVCDHFKVLRTYAGFRIDVDTKHADMTNLTDVMIFFIKLNGSDRTQSLTTNDLILLGLEDSGYATYLPEKVADPSPRNPSAISRTNQVREERERKNSEPPPGNTKRRDYDYEPAVSVPRPKTVTGATLQNEMRKFKGEQAQAKEPGRSSRHLHHEMTGSHTVAPMRKGGRTELPPHVRASMPDPTRIKKSSQTAASWQKDFHVHPKASPPKQREETPPPPCEATPVLGYENDKPGFDKMTPGHTMDAHSPEIQPPSYMAPAPPLMEPSDVIQPSVDAPVLKTQEIPLKSSVISGQTMDVHSPEIPPPHHRAPTPPHNSGNETTEPSVPAAGIPAPPPPPPIIGSAGVKPIKPSDKKHHGILVTGRKTRLSSADYDDVVHEFSNARRPTAPNIWGIPDQNARKKQMRSQSVPDLNPLLKGVRLTSPKDKLHEIVTPSVIRRHPPKSVIPKQSVSFDSGSDRSEVISSEPEVDGSHPGGVGTLSRRFGQMQFPKMKSATPQTCIPAKSSPIRSSQHSGQLYVNQERDEDVYINDQMDGMYVNEAVGGGNNLSTPIQYVNTVPVPTVKESPNVSTSGVDTSENSTVENLKKKLNLEKLIGGSPGMLKPQTPKVTSPEVRNIRDIPLPAIPVEEPGHKGEQIYEYLDDG